MRVRSCWMFAIVISLGGLLLMTGTARAQEAAPDFFVEAFISNDNPYLGEQILYGLRYYAYTVPPGLFDELPSFEGFWLSDVYEVIGGRVETIDKRQYVINEVYAEITPLREGEIIIAPSVLNIPATVFSDRQVLETESLVIRVRPLPDDAPESFNGAVGEFNAQTRIDQTQITLGQPVRLWLTVDGRGNLEQLPAPPLPDAPGWRAFANPSRYVFSTVGGLRLGQKVFEWLLIPEQAGTMEFPEVVFTAFDPQQGVYRSITAPPFTVEVFPGADNARALPTSAASEREGALPLQPVPGVLHSASGQPSAAFWLLWLAVPGVTAVTAGWVWAREQQRKRRLRFRQSVALRRAVQHIRTAQAAITPEHTTRKASQHIQEAIYGYFADKLGHNRAQVKTLDLRQALLDAGVDTAIAAPVMACLTEAEGGRFIPQGMAQDLSPLVTRTITALTALDRVWGGADADDV